MKRLLSVEWRYTYRSARRGGFGRVAAARKFAREVVKGLPQIGRP